MNPWKWKCFWFSPQKTKDDPCIKHPETESGIGSSATLEVETYSISSLPCHINPKKSFIQKRLTKSSENIPQQDYKGDNLARTFENPFFENNGIPVVIKRKIRLIMIGNHEVGKSSVAMRITRNNFMPRYSRSTLSVMYCMRKVENYYYDINIVDMGSDVAKLARVSSFEDHINGIVFVYSIDNPKSLDDLFNARDLICDTVDSIRLPCVVLGNKSDLPSKVPSSEGQAAARRFRASFAEVSAKTGEGIQQVFYELITRIDGQKSI